MATDSGADHNRTYGADGRLGLGNAWTSLGAPERALPVLKAARADKTIYCAEDESVPGSGLGLAEASVVMEEVNFSGGNSGAVHGQMYNMGTLLRHGSTAQKQTYLPGIASGKLRLQTMAVTEPTTGTDTTQLKTTAVKKGDRYILNGSKMWITNGPEAETLVVYAKTDPEKWVQSVMKRGQYPLEGRATLLELAGGVRGGRKLKAVIPGGSSMPVLTADVMMNCTMDYDSIAKAGSMLGSGAVIVIDDSNSMVDILDVTMHFYHHESCGQCTPCREGTSWMTKILERIRAGHGKIEDLDRKSVV